MPQINQLGGVQLLDLPVKNFTGSDIPDGTALIFDVANLATSNLPAGVVTSTGTTGIGFASGVIPTGKTGLMRVYGIAVAIAGGTINPNDVLMTNASGQVVTQTAAAPQVGYCLSAAVATDKVQVLISRSKNA